MKRKGEGSGLLSKWLSQKQVGQNVEITPQSSSTSTVEDFEQQAPVQVETNNCNNFPVVEVNTTPLAIEGHITVEHDESTNVCKTIDHLEVPDVAYQNIKDLPPPQKLKHRDYKFAASWYEEFKWIHYEPKKGSVFCIVCMKAEKNHLFTHGFSNWKKGKEKFEVHQNSQQHKDAEWKLGTSSSIASNLKLARNSTIKTNRLALKTIITTLKYLSKQGLAIQGKHHHGNFEELFRLRCEDIPEIKTWSTRTKHYLSTNIQNEICEIMGLKVLRTILAQAKRSPYFSIMVDETTDVSTKEQVSFCIRVVDAELQPHEYFLGLYETESTTGENITSIITDALLRCELPIEKLRGQCYDGAANMKGRLKGVQSRILELQPLATYVHCFNHSLNLALQDAVNSCVEIGEVGIVDSCVEK